MKELEQDLETFVKEPVAFRHKVSGRYLVATPILIKHRHKMQLEGLSEMPKELLGSAEKAKAKPKASTQNRRAKASDAE